MSAIIELKVEDRIKACEVLHSALQREYELLKSSVDRTKRNILSFERRYELPSQKFLKEYPGVGDDPDFIDWYGEIRILDVLNTEIDQITEMLEQCR